VVIALALVLVALVVDLNWTGGGAAEPSHGSHTLAAGPIGDFAVVVEHPHFENGSTPMAPDTIADAVLPRATVALVALALIAAIAVAFPLWRQASSAVIRGPPRRLTTSLSGRVLLTRMCIARR
jgi:hypothetical protein